MLHCRRCFAANAKLAVHVLPTTTINSNSVESDESSSGGLLFVVLSRASDPFILSKANVQQGLPLPFEDYVPKSGAFSSLQL